MTIEDLKSHWRLAILEVSILNGSTRLGIVLSGIGATNNGIL